MYGEGVLQLRGDSIIKHENECKDLMFPSRLLKFKKDDCCRLASGFTIVADQCIDFVQCVFFSIVEITTRKVTEFKHGMDVI